MMYFSHRQLRLAILPAALGLLAACGSSGNSDPTVASESTAVVSASPQPLAQTSSNSAESKGAAAKREPVVREGAGAPLDSIHDRVSKHVGTRLFATGFEAGISLTSLQTTLASPPYQFLVGSDISGYAFPVSLDPVDSQSTSRLQADVGAAAPVGIEYATNSIKTVAGRGGPTRALSLHNKAKGTGGSAQQLSMENADLASEPVVFQRMWVKFDLQTLDRARTVGANAFYQTFWEVKGQAESWLRLKLHYDGSRLVWVAKANGATGPEPEWSVALNTVPVILAPESSGEGWHKVEIWLDSFGGRFKVAIDGQPLVDRGDVRFGTEANRLQDFRMMMVSSTVAPLAEVLFDDLELWNLPPWDAFGGSGR